MPSRPPVRAQPLYNHVASKDETLDGAIDTADPDWRHSSAAPPRPRRDPADPRRLTPTKRAGRPGRR
ncbi:hypothetical protein GCM10009827_106930 [Dactylosporangium maewongense]|uniref:Uncharacterized protein n=1 Tax=Dactylosporangium maewongense TaxID=634393 RepID=A0ABP4NXU4_9ACTN